MLVGENLQGVCGVGGGIQSGMFFFFSSRRRHTRLQGDWSSDVCSSDLVCDGRQAFTKIANGSLFGIVDQFISRAFVFAEAEIAHERSLRVMEVAAAAVNEIGKGACRGRG